LKRIYALLLALLLLCCACSSQSQPVPTLLTPVKVSPDTAVAEYNDIFNLTSVQGCVQSDSEPLAFSVDGTVGTVSALPGTAVKKGETLAVLDTATLQKQLDSLKQQLQTAVQQSSLQNRNYELAVEIARLKLSDSQDSVEQNVLQVDLQQALLDQKQAKEQQAFQQQQISDSISQVSAQIEAAAIRAPFDGTVSWISARATSGTVVSAKAAMLYLAGEGQLSIRTKRISFSELSVCDRIYAKIGSKEYELKARESSISVDVQKSLNGIELTTTFDFIDPDAAKALISGNNALVCCRSGYRSHVLCVPSNALFQDSDGSYVYRMSGDEKTRVNVESGTVTTLRTEIVSGLAEGDVVYVKD